MSRLTRSTREMAKGKAKKAKASTRAKAKAKVKESFNYSLLLCARQEFSHSVALGQAQAFQRQHGIVFAVNLLVYRLIGSARSFLPAVAYFMGSPYSLIFAQS